MLHPDWLHLHLFFLSFFFFFVLIDDFDTVIGQLQDVSKIHEEIAPKKEEIEKLSQEVKKNEKQAGKLSGMIDEVEKKANECRREMVEMIRVILTLQDEIKAARLQHALSPRFRKKNATRQYRASTMSSVPVQRALPKKPGVNHKILPPTQNLNLGSI